MSRLAKSNGIRRSAAAGYTFIEMLAVMFIVLLAVVAYQTVRLKHGAGLAAAVSTLAVFVGIGLVYLLYRWSWSRNTRQLAQLREKYRTIYRVKELPADARSIVKPEGAEIEIGDYGWDARPARRDGLIHLQGLTKRWQVVWHAGFRPEQIEKVADKPASQYDHWAPYWATRRPPECPFPIRERNTPTMGLPHHSGHYFKEWPSQYYQSPLGMGSENMPGVTPAQFAARKEALRRQSPIWLLLFIALTFGTSRLCFYMDQLKPAVWIQVLTGCAIASAFVIYFVLLRKMTRHVAGKSDSNVRFLETK